MPDNYGRLGSRGGARGIPSGIPSGIPTKIHGEIADSDQCQIHSGRPRDGPRDVPCDPHAEHGADMLSGSCFVDEVDGNNGNTSDLNCNDSVVDQFNTNFQYPDYGSRVDEYGSGNVYDANNAYNTNNAYNAGPPLNSNDNLDRSGLSSNSGLDGDLNLGVLLDEHSELGLTVILNGPPGSAENGPSPALDSSITGSVSLLGKSLLNLSILNSVTKPEGGEVDTGTFSGINPSPIADSNGNSSGRPATNPTGNNLGSLSSRRHSRGRSQVNSGRNTTSSSRRNSINRSLLSPFGKSFLSALGSAVKSPMPSAIGLRRSRKASYSGGEQASSSGPNANSSPNVDAEIHGIDSTTANQNGNTNPSTNCPNPSPPESAKPAELVESNSGRFSRMRDLEPKGPGPPLPPSDSQDTNTDLRIPGLRKASNISGTSHYSNNYTGNTHSYANNYSSHNVNYQPQNNNMNKYRQFPSTRASRQVSRSLSLKSSPFPTRGPSRCGSEGFVMGGDDESDIFEQSFFKNLMLSPISKVDGGEQQPASPNISLNLSSLNLASPNLNLSLNLSLLDTSVERKRKREKREKKEMEDREEGREDCEEVREDRMEDGSEHRNERQSNERNSESPRRSPETTMESGTERVISEMPRNPEPTTSARASNHSRGKMNSEFSSKRSKRPKLSILENSNNNSGSNSSNSNNDLGNSASGNKKDVFNSEISHFMEKQIERSQSRRTTRRASKSKLYQSRVKKKAEASSASVESGEKNADMDTVFGRVDAGRGQGTEKQVETLRMPSLGKIPSPGMPSSSTPGIPSSSSPGSIDCSAILDEILESPVVAATEGGYNHGSGSGGFNPHFSPIWQDSPTEGGNLLGPLGSPNSLNASPLSAFPLTASPILNGSSTAIGGKRNPNRFSIETGTNGTTGSGTKLPSLSPQSSGRQSPGAGEMSLQSYGGGMGNASWNANDNATNNLPSPIGLPSPTSLPSPTRDFALASPGTLLASPGGGNLNFNFQSTSGRDSRNQKQQTAMASNSNSEVNTHSTHSSRNPNTHSNSNNQNTAPHAPNFPKPIATRKKPLYELGKEDTALRNSMNSIGSASGSPPSRGANRGTIRGTTGLSSSYDLDGPRRLRNFSDVAMRQSYESGVSGASASSSALGNVRQSFDPSSIGVTTTTTMGTPLGTVGGLRQSANFHKSSKKSAVSNEVSAKSLTSLSGAPPLLPSPGGLNGINSGLNNKNSIAAPFSAASLPGGSLPGKIGIPGKNIVSGIPPPAPLGGVHRAHDNTNSLGQFSDALSELTKTAVPAKTISPTEANSTQHGSAVSHRITPVREKREKRTERSRTKPLIAEQRRNSNTNSTDANTSNTHGLHGIPTPANTVRKASPIESSVNQPAVISVDSVSGSSGNSNLHGNLHRNSLHNNRIAIPTTRAPAVSMNDLAEGDDEDDQNLDCLLGDILAG